MTRSNLTSADPVKYGRRVSYERDLQRYRDSGLFTEKQYQERKRLLQAMNNRFGDGKVLREGETP